jgi:type I restriction enzyme M protein
MNVGGSQSIRTPEIASIGRSDKLGRYYTKGNIGRLLVSQMSGVQPKCVLDLGAGSGALSRAAASRWNEAQLVTVDIDLRSRRHLSDVAAHGQRHLHIRGDALDRRLPDRIHKKVAAIDTAICNPPFVTPAWRREFGEILEDAGLSGCIPVSGTVDAALVFLAQNLRVLHANGTLGVILPDTLACAAKYQLFRERLLSRYCVHRAIRLTRHSFKNTDALAHIVIISKGRGSSAVVSLQTMTTSSEDVPKVEVDLEQAAKRLDYVYHSQPKKPIRGHHGRTRLGDVCDSIARGTITSAERRMLSFPVVHTSDLDDRKARQWCDLRAHSPQPSFFSDRYLVRAQPGDILVARVGRNLESKVVGVQLGEPVLTDCVYRIRAPQRFQQEILAQLSGQAGRRWLESRTYGVSAKHLTKTDLADFPLAFSIEKLSRIP